MAINLDNGDFYQGPWTKIPSDTDWNPDTPDRWQNQGRDKAAAMAESRSPFFLSARSYGNLRGVDPRLSVVFGTAIQYAPYDFMVIEGVRTKERQRQLVDAGKSTTMNSRHLDGNAVDVAIWHEGAVSWDAPKYRVLADHIKTIAGQHRVPIEWGGDWQGFFDGPHFQLPWET